MGSEYSTKIPIRGT